MENKENAYGIEDMTVEEKAEKEANLLALRGYLVYNIALILAYFIEVIKGSRTIPYYITFVLLSILPLVIMFSLYIKNKADSRIKIVLAIFYIFTYNFTIFTTTSPVAFVYGILISLLIIVYGHVKISLLSGVGLFVFNAIYIAYAGINGNISSEDMPSVEIRIAFLAIYSIFMVMATKTIIKNNNSKIDMVEKEKEHVSEVLDRTMSISENMISHISNVSEKMDSLEDSVSRTKLSMTEVTNGTNDTSFSVQTQLVKTEEIQDFIKKVESVTDTINKDMVESKNAVNEGRKRVDELINQVNISEQVGNKVATEMEKLNSYATQMQNIVSIIENITSETSLLALNASIEAARVGEAGKGFGVVASEITNLADQTQSATVDIAELIGNLSDELSEVAVVISELVENTKLQSKAAEVTASSFKSIAGMTEDIRTQAGDLSVLVTELSSSNEEIVDSIQTISAATEEVTAHSNATLECSEENSRIVGEVGGIVDELSSLAKMLNNNI